MEVRMHTKSIPGTVLIVGTLSMVMLVAAPAGVASAGSHDRGAGHVYVLSNQAPANEVLVYERLADGTLAFAEAVPTGGFGSGTGTGSQGALALSEDGAWVLAVDPGSDTLSVLAAEPGGLVHADTVSSGGDLPISVAIHEDLVYVLNGGGGNNISGFHLGEDGSLTPIPDSTMVLSGGGVMPAQISFDPSGEMLIVTEKATNLIDTYRIGPGDVPTGPRVHPSSGPTPFGFAFDPSGHLIVSEAFGGAPDASAVSSYSVSGGGRLDVITGSLHDTETAACWIAISEDGRYAYTTNTGSGTVSGYAIHADGSLALLDANGVTGFTGRRSAPIDEDLSSGGAFLYVNLAGTHEVAGFQVGGDGSLERIDKAAGLPPGAVGIVAT
jgi:6-phosphogluconolactonase